MTTLKEFTAPTARPLPVIILADVSGSMATEGKIQALNHAVKEMIEAFREEDDLRAQIQVAVITFGAGDAKVQGAEGFLPEGGAALVFDADVVNQEAVRVKLLGDVHRDFGHGGFQDIGGRQRERVVVRPV